MPTGARIIGIVGMGTDSISLILNRGSIRFECDNRFSRESAGVASARRGLGGIGVSLVDQSSRSDLHAAPASTSLLINFYPSLLSPLVCGARRGCTESYSYQFVRNLL